MSYKDITAGKKIAKVVAGRIITSESGTPGIEVAFKFKEGEIEERITWVGWLTPSTSDKKGALEHTMRTLVEVLGFNGNTEIDEASKYLLPGTLDVNRDVELVIESEVYKDKQRMRVRWVNDPNAGGGFESMSSAQVKNKLDSIGFKAAFFSAKQAFEGGAPKVTAASAPAALPPSTEDIEVPF